MICFIKVPKKLLFVLLVFCSDSFCSLSDNRLKNYWLESYYKNQKVCYYPLVREELNDHFSPLASDWTELIIEFALKDTTSVLQKYEFLKNFASTSKRFREVVKRFANNRSYDSFFNPAIIFASSLEKGPLIRMNAQFLNLNQNDSSYYNLQEKLLFYIQFRTFYFDFIQYLNQSHTNDSIKNAAKNALRICAFIIKSEIVDALRNTPKHINKPDPQIYQLYTKQKADHSKGFPEWFSSYIEHKKIPINSEIDYSDFIKLKPYDLTTLDNFLSIRNKFSKQRKQFCLQNLGHLIWILNNPHILRQQVSIRKKELRRPYYIVQTLLSIYRLKKKNPNYKEKLLSFMKQLAPYHWHVKLF